MAEATLLGQNGSSGNSSINLMDFYNADKWEWHYITTADLSFPYTTWTKIIDVNQEGYLIGVALYNSNNIDSYLRININGICYLNNKNRSGIMWKDATYTRGGSGAYMNFYEINFSYQSNYKPFLNTPIIPDDSSINTTNRFLISFSPLPFSSFSVLMKNNATSAQSDQFSCVYVTKKS